MRLGELLPESKIDARHARLDIAGIAADSRKVKAGFLFFAIAGAKAEILSAKAASQPATGTSGPATVPSGSRKPGAEVAP